MHTKRDSGIPGDVDKKTRKDITLWIVFARWYRFQITDPDSNRIVYEGEQHKDKFHYIPWNPLINLLCILKQEQN